MQGVYSRNGVIATPFLQGYLLASRTVVTATGTSTYTTPANVKLLLVECIGGGGGGVAASASTAGNIVVGTGGLGAEYATAYVPTTPGLTFTSVVNAGGGSSGAGGVTSFTMAANGAVVCAAPGGNSTNSLANAATELFQIGGNTPQGTAASDVNTTLGQFGVVAHRVSGTVAISGKGGQGPMGGRPLARITQGVGADGGNYGAGGGGGLSINAGGAANGGHGAQGLIIVWEFVN